MAKRYAPQKMDMNIQQVKHLLSRVDTSRPEDQDLINELLEFLSRSREEPQLVDPASNQYGHTITDANELLETMIDILPIGAVITDPQGDSLFSNQAAKEILGLQINGSLEKSIRTCTMFYPDGRPVPPGEMPIDLALRENIIIRSMATLIRYEEGKERAILTSAAPVMNGDGKVVNGIALFRTSARTIKPNRSSPD